MKTTKLNCNTMLALSNDEMVTIDGGDFTSGYNAGAAAGDYIKRLLGDCGLVYFLYNLNGD